jgi:tape measure domain-containing protein
MALNVGTIYYEVESDTSKLVNSSGNVDVALDKMNRQFSRTDKAANSAQFQMTKTAAAVKGLGREADSASSSLGGFGKVLGGLLTLQGIRSLVDLAEGYGEMSERVRMATSSQQEYELVQQRLLDTANGTYRSLSEASEVYIRTADSLRAMGYTTAGAIDVVDSLSYLFVTNAASADRANSAIGAFTKALNKGKVEADGWDSILAAVPSVINDIASASGKTAAEIRQMGVSGEISARMLTEGLAASLEKNKDAAASMATNLKDAFRAFNNSLSVYLGEANNASGATGVLSSAIIELSKHIDVIVKTLTAAGAGAMALYIANTARAAIASAKAAVTAMRAAQAKAEEAKASTLAASAAGANTVASTSEAAAMNSGAAAAAKKAGALLSMASAQRAATVAGTALLGALGGLTGVIGLVASAAAGWYLFSKGVDTASGSLNEMLEPLDQVVAQFRALNDDQRAAAIVKYADASAKAAEQVEDAFANLLSTVKETIADTSASFNTLQNHRVFQQLAEDLRAARAAGEPLAPILQAAGEKLRIPSAALNSWIEQGGVLSDAQAKATRVSGVLATLRGMVEGLAGATNAAAAAQRNLNSAFDDAQTDDYLKKLKDRKAAIEDGNSAVKAAERYIKSLNNVSPERIEAIRAEAKAVDAATAAQSRYKAGAASSAKAATEQKAAEEQNAKALRNLAQQLYEAGLQGEALAAAKARSSLNSFATSEQVAQIEAMAVALSKVQQAEAARKKVGGTDKEVQQYIFGDVNPLSGGAFDNQTERYDAEAKAEQKRYEDQLKRLQEAKAAEVQQRQAYATMIEALQTAHLDRMAALEMEKEQAKTEGDAQKLESDIALEQTKYEDELARLQEHLEQKYQLQVDYAALEEKLAEDTAARQAQIEKAKAQVMLSSASDAFGSLAGVLKESQGEQSSAYKAMFAASKAFSIANAALALGTALSEAWKLPWPANLAAAATAAASVATIASNISAVSMGGGRQYGGNVDGVKMHRINENGQPEILNTASGRQYLLPNTRGEVVSNKEATQSSSAAPNISVNIHNAPPGTRVEQRSISDKEYILDVMLEDVMTEGRFTRGGSSVFGWRRQGR